MSDDKKLRLYQEYETRTHGRVKLLKYKNASPEKQKVCKVGEDPLDYFFIPESEIIPNKRKRQKRGIKRTPLEAQREFHNEMVKQGYKPKTFYISVDNLNKLEELKKKSGIKTWNEFMNEFINNHIKQ